MKKMLKKRLQNEKGLTLVELLAVIVIIGIIAAIAIPSIGNIIENSRIKAVKADAQNVLSAANMYFIENIGETDGTESGAVTVTIDQLINTGFLEDEGSLTTTDTNTGTVTKGSTGSESSVRESNTFSGSGTNGSVTVEFNSATSKMITDSGNDKTVGE